MKEKVQGSLKKPLSKWFIASIGIGVLAIILIIVMLFSGSDKEDFYSRMLTLLSQNNGSLSIQATLSSAGEDDSFEETTLSLFKEDIADGGQNLSFSLTLPDGSVVNIDTWLVDGVRYLDLQALRESLISCSDVVLISYGEEIPVNIGYLTISESDLYFSSLFTEESEKELSNCYGVDALTSRINIALKMFFSRLSQSGTVVSSEQEDNEYILTSTDEFSSFLDSQVLQLGGTYDTFTTNLVNAGLSNSWETEEGYSAQRDNFMSTVYPLFVKSSTHSSMYPDTVYLSSTMDVFDGDNVGTEYSGEISLGWELTDIAKSLYLTFEYTPSNVDDVVSAPEGTVLDYNSFNNGYLDLKKLFKYIFNTANITDLDLSSTSLSVTDDNLKSELKYIIESYLNTDDAVSYTEKNFGSDSAIDTLDSVYMGLVIHPQVDSSDVDNSDTPQDTESEEIKGVFENTSCEYEIKKDTESSVDGSLIVYNLRILNGESSPLKFDLSRFLLVTDTEDVYSANNLDRIKETFPDLESSIDDYLIVEAGKFKDIKIYFVVPADLSDYSIYLDNELLGK